MTWVKEPQRWLYFGPPDSYGPIAAIPSREWVEWRRARRREQKRIKRQMIIDRDGMICQLCGDEIESRQDLHIDHIVPLSRGGTSEPENLQPTHGRCNLQKGART